MIRFLQTSLHFDPQRLQADVAAIARNWTLHFNTAHYEGHWSGIPLRSPGGSLGHLYAESLNNPQPFANTPLLEQSPYLLKVLDSLPCEKTAVRLLKLNRGAIIKEHRDLDLNFEAGEARLHVPVLTHPEVEFVLDQQGLQMQEGECWYINANLPHRLSNPSPVDRIHLVIDCLVNDWMQQEFAREDLPVKNIKDTSAEDRQWQLAMIRELRLSGDPQRLKLADELEKSLGN